MKYVYTTLVLISALGLFSCGKWLDVMPKTSIPENELFKNEYGFKDALTGIYIKMGEPDLYGRELTYRYMDMLAGRYDFAPDLRNNWETIYAYDGNYKHIKNKFYSDIYNIIANLNNLLFYIEERKSVIRTKDLYETIKGEALGLRAYLHFDLLRMFGPVYSTDPEAKAIPYRTELNNVATPVLPASQVVEACLKDLLEANELLSKHDSKIFMNNPSAPAFNVMRQYRMNVWAVKAMLARVYLYKGDAESKAAALKYAGEVIESAQFLLYENNNENRILFSEHIFAINVYEYNKIVDADFVNEHASRIMSLSTPRFEELFEKKGVGASDFRCGPNAFIAVKEGAIEKQVLLKYDQTRYSDNYTGRGAIPLIRIPEIYYIMAECEPNPKLAAEYINTVRFARGIALSDAINGDTSFHNLDTRPGQDATKTVCINELMKEYQKEFYGEGQLFYFYKRHNYSSFYGLPARVDILAKYQFPLPDDEITFGK